MNRPTMRRIGTPGIDNSKKRESTDSKSIGAASAAGKVCDAGDRIVGGAFGCGARWPRAERRSGAWAAVAAAFTVLVASVLSLFAAGAFQSRQEALWALLFSMGLRMSIPMAACLVVLMVGGPLATGGFVFFVLAFYLVALPVETLLAMSQIGQKPSASF